MTNENLQVYQLNGCVAQCLLNVTVVNSDQLLSSIKQVLFFKEIILFSVVHALLLKTRIFVW